MSFQQFPFHAALHKIIEGAGFTTPTPIQEEAIPQILDGCDLRASAQTGTGKTGAFLLPCMHKLMTPRKSKARGPRVLVLVPTRELAMQVYKEAERFSKGLQRVKAVCIYGGVPYPTQNKQLSRPYEILIATPGRLIDHIERKRIDLSGVEVMILDEADRMLDMGFIQPVEEIAALTPSDRQTLLFSATMPKSVLKLSQSLLRDPIEIAMKANHLSNENIEQRLHYADDLPHKLKLLNRLLEDPEKEHIIIFTSTKRFADQLVNQLQDLGHKAGELHGDLSQNQRTRRIKQMMQGSIQILVATDVAARGIDIPTISHVINFDLPNNVEDYVHRIGRTGRAGAKGTALSFAFHREVHLVNSIETFTGKKIGLHTLPGLEPKFTKPLNSKKGGGRKPGFSRFSKKKPFGAKASSGSNKTGSGRSFSSNRGFSGSGKPGGNKSGKPRRPGQPGQSGRPSRPGRAPQRSNSSR